MSSFVTEEAKANVMLFWPLRPPWRLRPQLGLKNYTSARLTIKYICTIDSNLASLELNVTESWGFDMAES